MSLVHYSVVGHFDPKTVNALNWKPLWPIDRDTVAHLLEEAEPGLRDFVFVEDGCVFCQWSGSRGKAEALMRFADRLADATGAIVAETTPPFLIRYPPEAVRAQEEALEAWRASGCPQPERPETDNHQPAQEVSPYIPDWVRCPYCRIRFSLRSPASWNGERHRSCGQRLVITEGSEAGR